MGRSRSPPAFCRSLPGAGRDPELQTAHGRRQALDLGQFSLSALLEVRIRWRASGAVKRSRAEPSVRPNRLAARSAS